MLENGRLCQTNGFNLCESSQISYSRVLTSNISGAPIGDPSLSSITSSGYSSTGAETAAVASVWVRTVCFAISFSLRPLVGGFLILAILSSCGNADPNTMPPAIAAVRDVHSSDLEKQLLVGTIGDDEIVMELTIEDDKADGKYSYLGFSEEFYFEGVYASDSLRIASSKLGMKTVDYFMNHRTDDDTDLSLIVLGRHESGFSGLQIADYLNYIPEIHLEYEEGSFTAHKLHNRIGIE